METTVSCPWEDVRPYRILKEEFEVYPNRNSLPYVKEYGFDPGWKVENFVRGTIRLKGWAQAWSGIFEQVSRANPAELQSLSDDLWKKYAYGKDESDRVVLYVGLEARRNAKAPNPLWSRYYALDESGTGSDSAMARLVSLPATFAAEAIRMNVLEPGVSGAPSSAAEATRWMLELEQFGVKILSGNGSNGS